MNEPMKPVEQRAGAQRLRKTIRMRLGQGKDHPQRYLASLQLRQSTDIIKDVVGTALTWTVKGRDDAN